MPKDRDIPNEDDARTIAARFYRREPVHVRRFDTGLAHWVYDIRGPAGTVDCVVRIGAAEQRGDFVGALYWSSELHALGVPLARVLDRGEANGFPFHVLERLPGEDLGAVYPTLTLAQKQSIASAIHGIQRRVATLREGRGYGFVRLRDDPHHGSWRGVIDASIARSRSRIEHAGVVSPRAVDALERCVSRFDAYFATIRPTAFLDDVTTKNVIVSNGTLSGIVDVDWMCFGDPLLTVALTRASLRSSGFDTAYTDHWCELRDTTPEEGPALQFYTALFLVDFLSEVGQRFNKAAATGGDAMAHLEGLFDDELRGASCGL